MWFVHVDDRAQTIHIDSNQRRVISVSLPHTQTPNPGRKVLMDYPENTQIWDDLHLLVQAANRGEYNR